MITALTTFEPVFKGGKRWTTHHFKLIFMPNQINQIRLGQSVSKKISKSAVKRNYMKRYCREWLRLNKSLFIGLDCVLIHRKLFEHEELPEIRLELQKLIDITRKCQNLS